MVNLYDALYDPAGIDYGNTSALSAEHSTEREALLLAEIRAVLRNNGITDGAKVLEVGASLGFNHACHPNYHGVEYSGVAVGIAQGRYGYPVNVEQGDASRLRYQAGEFDFVFSFATLEHVPDIEGALSEIHRVLKRGGRAYLSPAWNCRPWTVEKLPEIPYSELPIRKRLAKFLIPLRENLAFRSALAIPRRLLAEVAFLAGRYRLRFDRLEPRPDLIAKYGHVADDDAFVSLDAHAAMTYYRAKGCRILSHPNLLRRVLCRGEAILVEKP